MILVAEIDKGDEHVERIRERMKCWIARLEIDGRIRIALGDDEHTLIKAATRPAVCCRPRPNTREKQNGRNHPSHRSPRIEAIERKPVEEAAFPPARNCAPAAGPLPPPPRDGDSPCVAVEALTCQLL